MSGLTEEEIESLYSSINPAVVLETILDEDLTVLLFGSGLMAGSSTRRNYIFSPIPPCFLKIPDAGDNLREKIIEKYREALSTKSYKRSMEEFNELITEEIKNYVLLDNTLKFIESMGGTAVFVSLVRTIFDNNEKYLTRDAELKQKFLEAVVQTESDKFGARTAFDFMRFVLANNKLSLQKTEMMITSDANKSKQYSHYYDNANDNADADADSSTPAYAHRKNTTTTRFFYYEVMHTKETEMEFVKKRNEEGSCFLYHGSGAENWYSLMGNGIIVASGTKLMTAGAAYGNGVYLSDSLSFSLGYSNRMQYTSALTLKTHFRNLTITGDACIASNDNASDINANNDASASTPTREIAKNSLEENTIVAIYEVVGKPETYKKTSSIFVVPDASLLIIRYLVALPKNKSHVLANEISKQLIELCNKRGDIVSKNVKQAVLKWHKRVRSDLAKISKHGFMRLLHAGETFDVKRDYKKKIYASPSPYNCEFEIRVDIVRDAIGASNATHTASAEIINTEIVYMKIPAEYPSSRPLLSFSNIPDIAKFDPMNHINKKSEEWGVQTNLAKYIYDSVRFMCGL